MTGTVLSVDPGGKTGFALIDAESEKVMEFGVVRRSDPLFNNSIRRLMDYADWLVIEAGQLPTGW